MAEDPRTAYMRLVLWAAAAKATAHFYGLNASDDDFVRAQLLLRLRSQNLLGSGTCSLLLRLAVHLGCPEEHSCTVELLCLIDCLEQAIFMCYLSSNSLM